MFIKAMTIEGVENEVEIRHTGSGALVTCDGKVVCELRREDDESTRQFKAQSVAAKIVGVDRDGFPLATGSMINDVLAAMERVAGF